MKNSILILAILVFLFVSCSNNQSKEHDQTNSSHQHDDGSVHQNHESDTVNQEEFTVSPDTSISRIEKSKEHTHDEQDRPHKH